LSKEGLRTKKVNGGRILSEKSGVTAGDYWIFPGRKGSLVVCEDGADTLQPFGQAPGLQTKSREGLTGTPARGRKKSDAPDTALDGREKMCKRPLSIRKR